MMTRMYLALTLAIAFVATAGIVEGQDDLRKRFAHATPSVGALYAHTEEGNLKFLCSITATDRHEDAVVMLTAWHCVGSGTAYVVSFNGRQFYDARLWKGPHYHIDPKGSPRIFGEPETDLALFLVDGLPSNTPIIPVSVRLIAQGDRVIMVGFPLGIAKIGYEGLVAGHFNRPGAAYDGYLLLQIFGTSGSSGSAIIGPDARIAGVLVAGRTGSIGLPVIFAVPIRYQRYLLEVKPK